jgi:hypothetical protein
MSVLLDIDGDSIVLHAPLVTTSRAKEIPGARHDVKTRVWRYPLSWATCVVARGVFGADLQVSDDLAEWARNEYATRIAPALSAREAKE